jgi:NTP pyrophosphatase (non-canonical NTP hydrolase)
VDKNQEFVAALRQALAGTDWAHPTTLDSWAWLVTEVAEVGDLLMRCGYGAVVYARNNPMDESIARKRLEHELGDVMIMLCTLANHLNIDLTIAMGKRVQHFARKYGPSGTEG